MKYLVVYAYYSACGLRIENTEWCFKHDPPTFDDVRNAEHVIEDKRDLEHVYIVRWIPLSDDDDDDW